MKFPEIKRVKIRSDEKGILYKDKEFSGLLGKGTYWFVNPLIETDVDIVSQRSPWLIHPDLDLIVKSGEAKDECVVIDLKDHERALVWIDNRFARILGPDLYMLWNTHRRVRVEVIDARQFRFEHPQLAVITRSNYAANELSITDVDEGHVGIVFIDGNYHETIKPGRHVFWKKMGKIKVVHVDLRESVLDIAGQEIMTADKVTLRLNSVMAYRVLDPNKAVCQTEDYTQALYREAQLAMRAVIGAVELDALLRDKNAPAEEMRRILQQRADDFGLKIVMLGIRDIILPGDMKELLNRVIESRKAAEANLITRREETAAMRSQANTAKLLDANPTLMRLRELEVLERIAGSSKLSVVLGEKGLAEKVMQLV